jgi:hypothetical protein
MQELAADEVMLKLNENRVRKARDQVAAAREETERNVLRQAALTSQAEVQKDNVDELVDERASAK